VLSGVTMAAESLAGLLQTSARAPPSHTEAGGTEGGTLRLHLLCLLGCSSVCRYYACGHPVLCGRVCSAQAMSCDDLCLTDCVCCRCSADAAAQHRGRAQGRRQLPAARLDAPPGALQAARRCDASKRCSSGALLRRCLL
jgi:hypothetical protein